MSQSTEKCVFTNNSEVNNTGTLPAGGCVWPAAQIPTSPPASLSSSQSHAGTSPWTPWSRARCPVPASGSPALTPAQVLEGLLAQ